MNPKPKLSFWQIWNMSIGFMGIQFGFALQNANTSRIFETLGANADEIPILWVAAPLTGLLVQPVIGYLSDHTWHPTWGRRRPFFLIGAILASLALIIMPNSSALWMAGGMLWIMDASINISMEPFRAFVGDMLPDEQRTLGFSAQTFFIGVGAVVASSLPYMLTNWFGVSNEAPVGHISDSVKWSYYAGAFAFFVCVLWTVLKTKEYPPENMEEFNAEKNESSFLMGIKESFLGIFQMPKIMKQLAWVQFFTWIALFAMWIYMNKAVTEFIYHSTDTTSKAYNTGADWVGVCFSAYSIISGLFALLIPSIADNLGRKLTHTLCLTAGGLGLISIYFISNPNLLIVSMVGVGIAWASILSMPYAMLSSGIPAKRMGYFMGVFNFFIVIPQIVASQFLGFLNKNLFGGQTILVLVFGGVMMIIAGLMNTLVDDK